MKQLIAKALRKLGLIFVADRVRYDIIYLKNFRKNKRYRASLPGIPLPPPYMVYETFRLDYQRYYEKGLSSAEWVYEEVAPFKELKNCDILDWGCGPGRVIRHLPAIISNGCRFYGTDYNPEYVKWCTENIKNVRFSKNELDPPLPYESGSFDLIYGISIFTHLSETKHKEWFAELFRVLKPKGILLVTTHGNITRVNLTPDEQVIFDKGNLVVRADVKEGHRMYVAYQPESYMYQLFAGKVKVLKHQPGQPQNWGLEQDSWVLEKI